MEEVYYNELPQLRKWIRKRKGLENLNLFNITMAPQSSTEARRTLIAQYQYEIKQAMADIPLPEEKLDRRGLNRLRGIVGGKKGR